MSLAINVLPSLISIEGNSLRNECQLQRFQDVNAVIGCDITCEVGPDIDSDSFEPALVSGQRLTADAMDALDLVNQPATIASAHDSAMAGRH